MKLALLIAIVDRTRRFHFIDTHARAALRMTIKEKPTR